MKVKEYLVKYEQAEDKDKAIEDIMMGLFDEIQTLMKVRNAKSLGALVACYEEQQLKWHLIAPTVGMPLDMFETVYLSVYPEFALGLFQIRARRRSGLTSVPPRLHI